VPAAPTYRLEVAWGDTPRTATPTYTDMTAWVRASAGVSFQRGRSNEQDPQAQPGRASWEFKNTDNRFTMGNASSPYAPLQIRRPVRISAVFNGSTYYLWQGFIDSWENASDETMGYVRVSASDRLARAGTAKLNSVVAGEILADSPVAYYPLWDSADSTTAGDVTGVGPVLSTGQVGTGGTLDFGAGVSPGPDAATVAVFTRASAGNGKYLGGVAPLTFIPTSSAYTIEAWFKTTTADCSIVNLAGTVNDGLWLSSGEWVGSLMSGAINDGEWHHLAVTFDGATLDVTYYLDGATFGGSTDTSGRSFNSVTIGYGPYGVFDGSIAHVAIYATELSAARIADHYAAGANGLAGESTSARFSRHCARAGLPSAHYTTTATGLSTMSAQPTLNVALLDALRGCAETENGVVYVNRSGVLTFAPRSVRYGAATALTLDARRAGHVGEDFTYTTDDSLLVNDITVARFTGATQRVVDATSVATYETHDESLTLYSGTDADALGGAEWRVYTNSTPRPRGSQLDVEVTAFNQAGGNTAALLAVEIGQRITVNGLPTTTATTATADLFVEGVACRIEKDRAVFSLTTSPATGSGGSVWILEDATWGALDGPAILAY
jgi:hypothetical protein